MTKKKINGSITARARAMRLALLNKVDGSVRWIVVKDDLPQLSVDFTRM